VDADEITPCTAERHFVDCRECRTNKNILGVRYLSLDDNEYNLCFRHFNPSEHLRDKVFLKIRSLLTNVNELDWDSDMVYIYIYITYLILFYVSCKLFSGQIEVY
jgi:hypothetical protein